MTTAKGPTTLMSTRTTTGSLTTTKIPSTTTTVEQGSTITEAGLISLDSINGVIYAIYNTKINQNSQAAEVYSASGQYHLRESPAQACDGDINTKYLNYGECQNARDGIECGANTGFYLELKRGASLVTDLQICTANDFPARDPLTVSLEGSLETITTLLQYIDSDQLPVEYGGNCHSCLPAPYCISVFDRSKENFNEKSIIKD
ncbi:unnamed protein product [Adineta steineri]|nr:unnamed protein product [Adineta steineri]